MHSEIPAPTPAPPLRLPDWPLPPYRFVPGLNPHPFRHPEGHLYTDGSAPEEEFWDPKLSWEEDRHWLRGLDLFDHRFYWEAHEAWEAAWHQVPRNTSYSKLLQGLIKISAYLLKTHLGHDRAAQSLKVVALAYIDQARTTKGRHYRGLDLRDFVDQVRAFETSGRWPVCFRTSPTPGAPDSDQSP